MFERICAFTQFEPSKVICECFPNILAMLVRSKEDYGPLTLKLNRRIIKFSGTNPVSFKGQSRLYTIGFN